MHVWVVLRLTCGPSLISHGLAAGWAHRWPRSALCDQMLEPRLLVASWAQVESTARSALCRTPASGLRCRWLSGWRVPWLHPRAQRQLWPRHTVGAPSAPHGPAWSWGTAGTAERPDGTDGGHHGPLPLSGTWQWVEQAGAVSPPGPSSTLPSPLQERQVGSTGSVTCWEVNPQPKSTGLWMSHPPTSPGEAGLCPLAVPASFPMWTRRPLPVSRVELKDEDHVTRQVATLLDAMAPRG